jgi:methionyl-tRNA formyltransferase
MKILLLTKSTPWCHLVQEVLRKSEHDVTVVEGITFKGKLATMAQGTDARNWEQGWTGDLIISYLFPHILSADTLARAPRAINFHPAPPWHPGFAPYSWAIYKGHEEYGITVHEMEPKVDSGTIVYYERLPIRKTDSIYRLQQRTMNYLFRAFYGFYTNLKYGLPYLPPVSQWSWPARTKEDFENLRRIPADARVEEIEARIRACRYPGQPGAYFPGEEA